MKRSSHFEIANFQTMSVESWLLTSLIVGLSAVIQGTTGFGFAVIAVPLLSFIYDPRSAIGMGMTLTLVSMFWMWFQSRQANRLPITRRLYLPAMVGLLFGLWVLRDLDVAPMRILVGAGTIVLAGCLWFVVAKGSDFTPAVDFPASRRWTRAVSATGFLSGFLMGSMSMGGPPVIALMTVVGLPKSVMRATIVKYFSFLSLTTFAAALLLGAISYGLVLRCAGYLPALILGIGVGNLVHNVSSQKLYMLGTLVLIIAAGAACLLSGVSLMM